MVQGEKRLGAVLLQVLRLDIEEMRTGLREW